MSFYVILAIHSVLCLILIALVLLQEGKDIGAAFGAGGGNSLFGAAGIDKPIVRATTIVAILFMVTSIFLVNLFSSADFGTVKKSALPDELKAVNKQVQADVAGVNKLKEEKKDVAKPVEAAPAPAVPVQPAPENKAKK